MLPASHKRSRVEEDDGGTQPPARSEVKAFVRDWLCRESQTVEELFFGLAVRLFDARRFDSSGRLCLDVPRRFRKLESQVEPDLGVASEAVENEDPDTEDELEPTPTTPSSSPLSCYERISFRAWSDKILDDNDGVRRVTANQLRLKVLRFYDGSAEELIEAARRWKPHVDSTWSPSVSVACVVADD